jgi:hypothetical protein
MNSKERRALYGAMQRLLDRMPNLVGGEDYELDDEYGTIPMQMYPSLTCSMGDFGCGIDNYRAFEPDLGDELLKRMFGNNLK